MDVIKLTLSPLATNCYIVITDDKNCVIIDPADEEKAIIAVLDEKNLMPKKILLTHGHFDHTGAAAALKEEYNIPLYIHEADECMLSDGDKALAYFCPGKPFNRVEADYLLKDGDVVSQDGVDFKVLHTPGHSAGSVCYIVDIADGLNLMFAGDTIFKDSIGRSDGYSGDYIVQQETLDKLKKIEEDYLIYPGHGPSTTLKEEKRFNPFIAGF